MAMVTIVFRGRYTGEEYLMTHSGSAEDVLAYLRGSLGPSFAEDSSLEFVRLIVL